MSDCDVCIGGNYDGAAEFSESYTIKKSRKEFQCCECRQVVPKGSEYEKWVMRYEGDWLVYRTCASCAEIRTVFTCGKSWVFEWLWEDMRDMVFPVLTTATKCLQKLSARNKARVIEEWQKWKGLAA